MGIVLNQSLKNTFITYIGFGLGAINVLFLYTYFLSDEYHGLVAYVFSTSYIMMPVFALGAHNTLIKFYSSYTTKKHQNSFLMLMLFLPIAIIIPVGLIGTFSYEWIASTLAKENVIIKDHVWLIYLTAICLSYFEIFYAWAKVQLQSVFGNFMKEVFHRLGAMILFVLIYFDLINVEFFIYGVVLVYALRMVIMKLYAFIIHPPIFKMVKLPDLDKVLKYSFLIIIAGSVASVILEIDKTMLGNFISIENVAYYGVAIYIATVIGVPARSMYQITNPLTAKFLNENQKDKLETLYHKSSLNLFIISGFIFLLITCNVFQLYQIIPEAYSGALVVVLIVSVAKLTDNIVGNANAILFNSDYYRIVLMLGILLALMAVCLNLLLIPQLGILGAAIATFVSVVVYNALKVWYVYRKFQMLPFTKATFKTYALLLLGFAAFYFWETPFHPMVNIALKSILISAFYGLLVYRLRLSEDINTLLDKVLKK